MHLRLPTSFCAPNFAYLMASDAKDVLVALPWTDKVVVELDDHHDSDLINRGLAADAGYRGTFRHEAEQDLDELRTTFRRKAHTAAMERCLTELLRAAPDLAVESLGDVRLGELPQGAHIDALRRRRTALGLPDRPDALVLVDHDGRGYPADQVPLALRRARSTRISIDGNAHFCRGLLRTRYPGGRTGFRAEGPRPVTADARDPVSTMRAVQVVGYHQPLEMREVAGARAHRPVRRDRADRRRRRVPHRPPHPRGAVAGEVRRHAALHDRARERRLGARRRHRGHQRRRGRQGDRAPAHHLRAVPGLPVRRRRPLRVDQFPGIDTDGGYADYLKTSARSVVRIDDSLEPADVAALADAGLTAYHAVAKAARRLTPRDRCVVIGAGGLGHIGIQVLKALSPAELIVVDRNPDAVKLAVSIGADHGVVAEGRQVDEVRDLTDGNGAEVVIDFVGEGGSTSEGVRMLREAGDYHVVGYGENVDVPTIDIISAEINFIGNLVGSYNDLCDLMALAARGKVKLHTVKYPLDDFQKAIDDLDNGRVRGRAILVP